VGTVIGTAPSGRGRWTPFVIGTAVPLALAGLAYLLWFISDRLLYVGPLDRATFGWVVVMPVWIAAPVAAGFVWRGLDQGTTRAVAAVVGTVIAAVAGLLLWQSVAFPACGTGAIHSAQEMVLPSLFVGVVVGGGVAVSCLASTLSLRRGRLFAAVALGVGCEALTMAAAIVVAASLIFGPACQRPSI
jgi:hypothetical protein